MSTLPTLVARRASLARAHAALPLLVALACSDPLSPAAPDVPTPRPELSAVATTPDSALRPATSATPSASLTVGEFSEISIDKGGTWIAIYFKYSGTVNPVFTVGTGFDVFATQKTFVAAKKLANGYWRATVTGLDPGKAYWVRLDNLKSTYKKEVVTLQRNVVIDIDSIHVNSDGDWGVNCGDLMNGTYFNTNYMAIWSYKETTSQYCVSSGETLAFPGQGLGVAGTSQAYHVPGANTLYVAFQLHDEDSCLDFSIACGPNAVSYVTAVDIVQPGTKKFVVATEKEDGHYQTTKVNAVWYFRVIVTYQ